MGGGVLEPVVAQKRSSTIAIVGTPITPSSKATSVVSRSARLIWGSRTAASSS
ncbi:MAG: hypothetical protein M3071_05265 [Actinomycetota bacterium]|nr:hypothetical protein [Actinomycetota bacterium]